MTVRSFGNGWQADFYAYSDRIRKVFPTRKDAQAYEGKIKAAIRENRFFDIKEEAFQIFKELSTWYLALDEVKRKRSFKSDRRSVNKLNDFFGTRLLRHITPSLIGEYQTTRIGEKSYRGQATKPATVNREVATMKSMFNKAIREGKLEKKVPLQKVLMKNRVP